MVRWSVLAAGTVAVMATAFVTGAAVPAKTAKPPEAVKADAVKPPVVLGQRTGYFNMAKVMREYKRAKTSVERLNARRNRLSANVVGLRAMHESLQAAAQKAVAPQVKEGLAEDLRLVARQIEDADREINKILNDRATLIITELYDEIHTTAVAVSRENGLTALLAYPDAVTREERENPQIKELKLKPPALQPFYVEPSAEFSDEIVRRLNAKFDEDDNN